MTLGQWLCGKIGTTAKKGSECPLAVEAASAYKTGNLLWWEMEGEKWRVFYSPIINPRDYPSLWNLLHSPSPFLLFLPGAPPTHPSFTHFFCLYLSGLWFCSYSSYPPLTPLSRSQQGLTWLWELQIPHTPLVTISGESPCNKTLWTILWPIPLVKKGETGS